MAIIAQEITDEYAIYNGDCCEVIQEIPAESVGFSVYSPPFCSLYTYSSSARDMSNCSNTEEFFEHYGFLVGEVARVTIPGRLTAVHCCHIPNPGQKTGYYDFPSEIIKLHEEKGFYFFGRIAIWKEPLKVALRTRLRSLMHKHMVKDSTNSTVAAGDFLLIFKKKGENPIPVDHKEGFSEYIGGREVPESLLKHKGETDQRENKLSHWIWRNYASCF